MFRKAGYCTLLSLLFLSFPAWSLGECEAALDKIEVKPFLYKAVRDGITSYIFGTLHGGADLRRFPETVLEALEASSYFVVEDLGQSRSPSPVRSAPALPPLSDKSRTHLALMGVPEKLWRNDGFLGHLYLSWPLFRGLLDGRGLPMLDQQLMEQARALGKSMLELDDEAIHIAIARSAGEVQDANALIENRTPDVAVREYFAKLTDFYSGDEVKLADLDSGPDTKTLVKMRNEKWIGKLKPYFGISFFAAVGCGHLRGEKGLLKLLEREGFVITRVP